VCARAEAGQRLATDALQPTQVVEMLAPAWRGRQLGRQLLRVGVSVEQLVNELTQELLGSDTAVIDVVHRLILIK
jgi:hypothetical protein